MAQEPKNTGNPLECYLYAETEPTAEQKRGFTEFLSKNRNFQVENALFVIEKVDFPLFQVEKQ